MKLILLFCAVLTYDLVRCENIAQNFKPIDPRDGFQLDDLPKKSRNVAELTVKYKRIADDLLKRVLPLTLKVTHSAKLDNKCTQSVHQLIIGIRQLKEWAINLLDSSGKIQSGLMDGTKSDFGDYDGCLSITANRFSFVGKSEVIFKGQYCLVEFTPPNQLQLNRFYNWDKSNASIYRDLKTSNTIFRRVLDFRSGLKNAEARLGICIPSSCTSEDLNKALELMSEPFEVGVRVIGCEIKTSVQWKSEHVGFFTIFGVLLLLVILGTAVEIYERRKPKFSYSARNDCCYRFWSTFSLFSSLKRLTNTEDIDQDIFRSARGIRLLTMIWIVLANCQFFPYAGYFYKNRKSSHSIDHWDGLLANQNHIDTLLVMSGILLSYQRGRAWLYKSHKLELWKNFARVVFRFLPAIILTIWMFIIFPILGDGPQWDDLVKKNVDVCRQTWWRSLLFIQNYWDFSENCMMHTWFISILVQFSFFSIVLVYLLYKKPFLGLFVNLALIFGTTLAIGFENVSNNFPPNLSRATYDIQFLEHIMDKVYLQSYAHIGPFCIGLLVGCVLARRHKLKINKYVLALGWFLSLFVFCAIVSGHYRFPYRGETYTTMSALYAATHRISWAVAVAWVCVACANGYGGFINTFLSWRIFVQYDRLSYFIYLFNPLLIFYFTGRARDITQFGTPELIISFLGILILTFILSLVSYVCFQHPLSFLDRLLFERLASKKEEEESKEVPDPEAIFQMYNEARHSISNASGTPLGTPQPVEGADGATFVAKRKTSTVNFKETPEIFNEGAGPIRTRRVSNTSTAGSNGKARKSSMKMDLVNDNHKMITIDKEQDVIPEEAKPDEETCKPEINCGASTSSGGSTSEIQPQEIVLKL